MIAVFLGGTGGALAGDTMDAALLRGDCASPREMFGPAGLLGGKADNRLAGAESGAFFDFPFTDPDDGREYVLSMQAVVADGRPLHFLEHVFDFAGNRHTPEVLAVSGVDLRSVYRSMDSGASWYFVTTLTHMATHAFTTSSGSRLVLDPDTRRFRRYDAQWHETPCDPPLNPQSTIVQSMGQYGDSILLAEYCADDAPEAHVYRSRDDGVSWETVFTMPAGGASAPSAERIRHFHVVQPDPYHPGHWYLFSGDLPHQCRVWLSKDDGDTWLEVTDPAPEGTDLQSVHRQTAMLFTPDALMWATDDWMGHERAVYVVAQRGEPMRVRAVSRVTLNLVRSIVSTDIGTLILPENNGVPVPGPDVPGVELGLLSKGGRYVCAGFMEEGQAGFTYSRASRYATDGTFVSSIKTDSPDYRMARWALRPSSIHLVQMTEGDSTISIDLPPLGPPGCAAQFARTVTVDSPGIVRAELDGDRINVTPLTRGEARLTAYGDIGPIGDETIRGQFRVLVHPMARPVRDAPFTFSRWPDPPQGGAFPGYMLFLQSDTFDPGCETPLQHAYTGPHGSRIKALGEDGVSFINEASNEGLGGVLLAVNTKGSSPVYALWRSATVSLGERICGIRLQYRIGKEGLFRDVLAQGRPVEYVPTAAGDERVIGPVWLPDETRDCDYVQLLWRYYLVSGTAGPRTEVRLDDVRVSESIHATGPSGVLFKSVGAHVSLTCCATNVYGTPTYQWVHGSTPETCEAISGATGPTLALTSVAYGDSGWYACHVSDDASTTMTPFTYLLVSDEMQVAGGQALFLLLALIMAMGAWGLRRAFT